MECSTLEDDTVKTNEHREEISERRVRVFPRRLTRKKPEEIGIDERRMEERRKGDRRSRKEEKKD